MYKKILVPLDGSKLAECALPHAVELAKGCDTEEVILVSVTEKVRGGTRARETYERYQSSDDLGLHRLGPETTVIFGKYHATDDPGLQRLASESTVTFDKLGTEITVTFGKLERQALRYLNRIAKRLEGKGIKVCTEVLLWPPAEAIAAYAQKNDVNIIVMASHGRSGPSRLAHGSVAEKVLKTSCIPVLMVRAPGCIPDI